MTTPKITGDEPYYPFLTSNSDWTYVIQITDETGRNLLNFVSGITIRQKFIADFMTRNILKGRDAAEKSFQSYLKVINGE